VASEIDAVGVVDDAVENRVGAARITDEIVPLVDWDLTAQSRPLSKVVRMSEFPATVRRF
jgi:hypothetical protein